MKTYYYCVDDGAFIYPSGDRGNVVPELFYQERTVWRIFLRNGGNAADISGIVAWGAAVGSDFCTGSPPMCRTLSDDITADAAAGSVTVVLDCATAEFLAAVNGTAGKPAWFELYGLDGSGRMVLHVMFEIRARMTIDPDSTVDVDTPETVATKAYTSALVGGAVSPLSGGLQRQIDERPTSSGARQIAASKATEMVGAHNASGNAHPELFAAVIQTRSEMPAPELYIDGPLIYYTGTPDSGYIAGHTYQAYPDDSTEGDGIDFLWRDLTPGLPSGAIVEGRPFSTTVCGYTVALTSGGGLAVSGSGASVALSGGQIVAKHTYSGMSDNTVDATLSLAGDTLNFAVNDPDMGSAGFSIGTQNARTSINGKDVYLDGSDFLVAGDAVATEPWADSRFARQLVTSTDSSTTSAVIPVLSGSTSYKFTQPLEVLSVGSAAETTEASYIRFTLAPGARVDIPADVEAIAPGLVFDAGGKYLLRFFDGTLTADFDVERPVESSTGAWLKSGAAVLASGMAVADAAVSGGETLTVYDRGYAVRASVNSGGTMHISSGGVGSNVIAAEAGGKTSVYAGGVLSDVTLSGGPVTVAAGGYVDGAHIHSGNLGVFGTAVNAVLYSGENFRLYRGGFASDATIRGGVCYVSSGASATGLAISGGVCAPHSGASVTFVTIRGGVQYVSGIVSGIILSGGTLRVFSGGTALAVTSFGGNVTVAEGGYIEYATE